MRKLTRATLSEQFDVVNAENRTVYVHRASQLTFLMVHPGWFQFGFSEVDLAKAKNIDDHWEFSDYLRDLFNAHNVFQPKTMLVSESPIADLNLKAAGYDPAYFVEPMYLDSISLIDYKTASQFCNQFGFRLLTEIEWEYCHRGGADTLFVWGDSLLEHEELARWMTTYLSDSPEIPCNGFGFKNLFNGEGCSDRFTCPNQPAILDDNDFVVKAGAASLWPWQYNEWIWCIPSIRTSSKFQHDEGFSFRVAVDITVEI